LSYCTLGDGELEIITMERPPMPRCSKPVGVVTIIISLPESVDTETDFAALNLRRKR
jgi:hypothetical protein